MKLIVGLGNPGKNYSDTRHNIGFYMLNLLVLSQGFTFKKAAKHKSLTAELTVDDVKVLFVQPQTFYNLSGESIRSLMDFYKLSFKDILVIHDELALPFGSIRTRWGGSDAGNNGIKSLISHIGPGFARIRIGIYNELRDKIDDADFVLSKFSSSERALMDQIEKEVKNYILQFVCEEDFGATTKRIKQ